MSDPIVEGAPFAYQGKLPSFKGDVIISLPQSGAVWVLVTVKSSQVAPGGIFHPRGHGSHNDLVFEISPHKSSLDELSQSYPADSVRMRK